VGVTVNIGAGSNPASRRVRDFGVVGRAWAGCGGRSKGNAAGKGQGNAAGKGKAAGKGWGKAAGKGWGNAAGKDDAQHVHRGQYRRAYRRFPQDRRSRLQSHKDAEGVVDELGRGPHVGRILYPEPVAAGRGEVLLHPAPTNGHVSFKSADGRVAACRT
jgi:hypothetical protein